MNSVFQWSETGNHLIPRLNCFGDRGDFVLPSSRNVGAKLSADGTDHSVDNFVTPARRAAGTATDIGFRTTGAMSLSHASVCPNSRDLYCSKPAAFGSSLRVLPQSILA